MQKVCVVSGGSSGIGLSIVQRFLADDYHVFNLDVQPSDVGEFILCDMTSFPAVEQAITNVLTRTRRIDTVVSNAGIHFSAKIEDTSIDDFDRIIEFNLKSAYALIRSVLPAMKAQKHGVITIVGSDQSLVGKPNSFAYGMTKHALASIAKTTAIDYASFNIRANIVCPGTIETPLYHSAIDRYCEHTGTEKAIVHREEEAMQPAGRLGRPEEVAAFVRFLSDDDSAFITGSLQVIDGGYTCQ